MRRLCLAGICAALALSGCGGSDSGSDTASAPSGITGAATAEAPRTFHQSTAGQDKGKGKEANGSAPNVAKKDQGSSSKSTPMVKVPPISSAPVAGSKSPAPGVKTVKGADDSVQTYGVEADESARTEAAIALQAYLNDLQREDWEGVCSALAQRARAKLAPLIKQLQSKGEDVSGCAGAMAALDKGTPQSQLQEDATITEVLSFRGEGDIPGNPSYLIFKGPPGSTLYSMPMYLEGGGWKVGLALPSELPL